MQVRDVPDDVLALLRKDAARNGLSLQGYLRGMISARAAVINNNEVLERASARLTGKAEWSGSDAAELIRQGRAERNRTLGIDECS